MRSLIDGLFLAIFPTTALPLVVTGQFSVLAALVVGLISLMMALVRRRTEPQSEIKKQFPIIGQEACQEHQELAS